MVLLMNDFTVYDLMIETHPAFPPTAVDASLRDLLRLAVQLGGAK